MSTLAASYMAATRSWLNSSPRLAQAVDEAWIRAAHEFETDRRAWADAAQAYANHAQPDSYQTVDDSAVNGRACGSPREGAPRAAG